VPPEWDAVDQGGKHVRCVGRTDDMLIYRAMNVFPSAICDVVMRGFQDAVEPYLRIWKDRPDQVRYDAPIPVDVEASPGLATGRYDEVARAIERELRGRLQLRAAVTVLARRRRRAPPTRPRCCMCADRQRPRAVPERS